MQPQTKRRRPPSRAVLVSKPDGEDILSCGHTYVRVLRMKEFGATDLTRECERCRTRAMPEYITGTRENRVLLRRAALRARRLTGDE